MFPRKKIYLLLFITLFPIITFGQISEQQIEQIYESSENFDYSEEQIDYIEFTRQNKINLLYASVEDLIKFPFFDRNIAIKVLEYVRKNPTNSVELMAKNLNLRGEQILILQNCTIVEEKPLFERFELNFRTRYKATNDPIYGFEKSKFLGNDLDLSNRLKLKFNKFGMNLIIDKDEGERNLIDYYSGNIWFDNNQNFKLILGDFEYQLGMGNILWKAFSNRKGINNISPVIRFEQSSKAYFSTLDYARFRGISADYSFKVLDYQIHIGGFYSDIKKAATYDSSKSIITSIYTSGLYRTQTEINKIDKIHETSYSANISFSSNSIIVGSGLFKLEYDKILQTTSSKFPKSNSNLYKTFFAFYNQENYAISTELSFDEFNNHGFVLGTVYNYGKTKFAFQIRSFAEYFRSPYGNMFGEFSYPANEYGSYVGLYLPLFDKTILTSFFDYFKTYGKTYSIEKPVYGFTLFNQIDYNYSSKIASSSRLVVENKTNEKKINNLNSIYQQTKYLLRHDLIYTALEYFSFRLRNEIKFVDNSSIINNEMGFANFIEVYYNQKIIKVGLRLSLFDTDSYDSAIWQYEYLMQGSMYSFPAYLQGSRYLFYCKILPLEFIKIELNYNITRKNNTNSLGSGNDEILRNYSNNLFFQIVINY